MASKDTGTQTPAKTAARKSPKSTRRAPQRASNRGGAARQVRAAQSPAVDLPLVGQVQMPRPEELAYYVGITALAAAEIIDWPVALIVGVGHALAYRHHNRVAQELGEAFDEGRAAQQVGEALAQNRVLEEVLEALPEPPA